MQHVGSVVDAREGSGSSDPDGAPAAPRSRSTGRHTARHGTRGSGSGPSTRSAGEGLRDDIQGLRAVAVLIVLLFHFWPRRLTGGYVGVDVFFVISGFLITSHLLRTPPTTPRLLAEFWARRVRRLLPAAFVVLGATLLAALVWLPSTQLPVVARDTIASALSVENWALVTTATDYLASEGTPSPLQHYWSLSVEEQFYVLWPLLIAVLAYLGRGRRPVVWFGVGLLVVTGASLVASVVLTRAEPASAYFVTHTRVWELGIGAVLAFAGRAGWALRHHAVRAVAGWLGLAMIAWAAVRFDEATPFPGTAALLPTVGAAVVIAAASDGVRWSPGALLGSRPARVLGDLSYSVYLWHWPVVVIAPFALARDLAWPDKLVAVAAVLVAAALTKRFVEDPVRRARPLVRSLPRSAALAAASALVVSGAGLGVMQHSAAAREAEEQTLAAGVATRDCLGAEALRDPSCTSLTGTDLLSSPVVAKEDKEVLYADGCFTGLPFTGRRTCTYGAEAGTTRVALLGNSHAGQWEPALTPIAKEEGWRLDTYLAFQCYTVTIPIAFWPEEVSENCTAWNEWALEQIEQGDYDVVVVSNRTSRQLKDVAKEDRSAVAEAAYAATLERLAAAGTQVVVIRDNPTAIQPAPDCVDKNLHDLTRCSNPVSAAVEDDPLFTAATKDDSGAVTTVDLTDRFCRDERCYHVIGDLIAYRDYGHLTTTYVRTLEPDLRGPLEAAVARSRG